MIKKHFVWRAKVKMSTINNNPSLSCKTLLKQLIIKAWIPHNTGSGFCSVFMLREKKKKNKKKLCARAVVPFETKPCFGQFAARSLRNCPLKTGADVTTTVEIWIESLNPPRKHLRSPWMKERVLPVVIYVIILRRNCIIPRRMFL